MWESAFSYLRLCPLLIAILLAIVFSPPPDKPSLHSGPAEPVDPAYFGMHIHRAASNTAWPPVPFEEWRLWDAGVAWPQLEPERGKWDFARLDAYVTIAAEHHVEILLTLGLTPGWASSRPDEASAYGKGNAAAPLNLNDWEEYVRVVATRYKGRIHNYEIWNEPNVKGTFTGTAAELLKLSQSAYGELKSVDPTITVVSPSATAEDGVTWLDTFLAQGGCAYADVIGYHFYVTPAAPEAMIPLIRKVKESMRRRNCEDRPLWNTETGWAKPRAFSSEEEAAGYLMRTYQLNWLMDVRRCYWYAWDNHNWSTLDLTARDADRMTKAGAAYGVIHQWMVGGVLRSCSHRRSGIWICEVEREGSKDRIVWSEEGTADFTVPPAWRAQHISNWAGVTTEAGVHIKVGPAPVLLSEK